MVMNIFHFVIRFLLVIFPFLWIGCNRLSEKKLQECKLSMEPVVDLLARLRTLPASQNELEDLCAREKVDLPNDLVYGRISSTNYMVWRYVNGRVSLVYNNEYGLKRDGAWYLDYENGTIRVIESEPAKPPSAPGLTRETAVQT